MEAFQMVLHAAQERGIIPITSRCNVACLFCSHRSNPPGVKTYRLPPLSLEQIEDILSIMPVHEQITIGESVTTISEGEPFTHPQWEEVLSLVRKRFPGTLISITTNGTLLTTNHLQRLKELQPIYLNISLNCVSSRWREKIMPGHQGRMPKVMSEIAATNISFGGSLVAMPHITGWDEINATIAFLEECGAEVVRVFLPGYTRYSPANMFVPGWVWPEVQRRVKGWRKKFAVPLLLEPSHIDNLEPVSIGVISRSPAAQAGLRSDSKFLAINDEVPRSRVEAFYMLKKLQDPKCKVFQQGKTNELYLRKAKGAKSGVVVEYDLSPHEIDTFNQLVGRYSHEGLTVLTSELAFVRLKDLPISEHCDIFPVKSKFFGGNIVNAGLLTVDDYKSQLDQISNLAPNIVLPGISFNQKGVDICRKHYNELKSYGNMVIA